MPKRKLPALMFYTGDWLKDPQVRRCSPATRGVWVDLLCYMHEDDQCGRITGTLEQLARLCGCSEPDMNSALDELQDTGCATVHWNGANVDNSVDKPVDSNPPGMQKTTGFSRPYANVTLTNRRMRAEWKRRQAGRERARKARN